MALPLDLYILSTGYAAHLHSDVENRKEGVTMTLPESETVDRKCEEKTQNTDSHNTIKLKQPTRLEKTIATLQYNTIKDSTQTIHKSVEKGSSIRIESTIYSMRSLPPLSTSLAREYIISAFVLPDILCLKVPVEINLPCRVHTIWIAYC